MAACILCGADAKDGEIAAFKLRIAELEAELATLRDQIKRAERQRNYLLEVTRQFAQADLNETNCADLEVASRRIRYLAQAALDHVSKELK